MNTIILTDTEARIDSITTRDGITTVELEWGGPDDHSIYHFDLDRLCPDTRERHRSCGGNLVRGWVNFFGECLLKEGDTIPLLETDEEGVEDDA